MVDEGITIFLVEHDMSLVMAVFILVPILAPTIGAGVLVVVPWQGVFITCGLLAVAVVVWSLRLSETLDPADRRPLSVRTTWGATFVAGRAAPRWR